MVIESIEGLPLTERTRRTIQAAVREATQRGDRFIGTEHLLMGILSEPAAVASRILAEVGLVGFIRDRLMAIMESPGFTTTAPPVADPQLRDELLRRRERDQALRTRSMTITTGPEGELPAEAVTFLDELRTVDRDNTDWLKAVVRTRGWPARSQVGYWGADAAWLLAQHADHDPAFQRECLELLEKAVDHDEAPARHLAYLTDRVLRHDGRPQRYGTQFVHGPNGIETPPLEDPDNVDELRAAVGLEPLCMYLERSKRMHQRRSEESG